MTPSRREPSTSPEPSSFLPLKPDVFLVLTILAEGERHGYGIMQAAESWAGRGMEIQAGALYRRLRWMTERGLIEEVWPSGAGTEAGDRRRTYAITPFGRKVAREEGRRMEELLAAARRTWLAPSGRGV